MIYYGLKHVERIPKSNGLGFNYYLRPSRRHGTRRARLPDVSLGERECRRAHGEKLDTMKRLAEENASIQQFITVETLLKRHYRNKSVRCSAQTKKLYKRYMTKLIDELGAIHITQLTKKRVQSFRDAFKSATSANEHLKFLKAAMNYAQEEDLLNNNPIHKVKLRDTGGIGRVAWMPADIEKYRSVHPEGTWQRLTLELLLATGCRISDVVLLTRDNIGKHVQYDTIEYVSKKTKTKCHICIPDTLKPLLHRAYRDGGHILRNPVTEKSYTTPSSFAYHFKKACKAAGITKTAHGLRKSAAIAYAEGNASNKALNSMFGWKDIRTADKYTKQASARKTGLEESARQISKAEHALRISGAMYA